MQLKKIRHYFESASYQKKLKHLIFAISILFTIFIVLTNLIWRQLLVSQIYDNASVKINVSSTNLQKTFRNIEYLSFRAIGNSNIQSLLAQTNDISTTSTERFVITQSLNEEIDDLTMDADNIKNVFLLNQSNENLVSFIYDTKNILPQLSIDDIVTELGDKPNKGKWYFDENLTYAVYARKIYSTSKLNLDYLGTIIFVIDSSFIVNEFKQNETYHDNNIFLLQYQNQFYTDKKYINQHTNLKNMIEKNHLKSNSLGHIKLDHINYYV